MSKCIRRGQVWFYKPSVEHTGCIQRGPRPVIIVSNDILNKTSSVILGVPCTTQIKKNFATHAMFIMNKRVSVALTEQIMPINVEELTTLEYILEDYIMQQVDRALLTAVALNPDMPNPSHKSAPGPEENVNNSVENVDTPPASSQIAKFYSRYPQLASSWKETKGSRRSKWTEQKAKQLVEDFQSIPVPKTLESKYGLSYETLRRYYYKFRTRRK